jgi:hypothetical protein
VLVVVGGGDVGVVVVRGGGGAVVVVRGGAGDVVLVVRDGAGDVVGGADRVTGVSEEDVTPPAAVEAEPPGGRDSVTTSLWPAPIEPAVPVFVDAGMVVEPEAAVVWALARAPGVVVEAAPDAEAEDDETSRTIWGSLGDDPWGPTVTRTASRTPTPASPASMPRRCERCGRASSG